MLSNKKIIKKRKNIKANLQNYEKMYKTFSWDTAKKELSIVANHKLNAAHIAIDVHTQSYRKNKVALYYEGEL